MRAYPRVAEAYALFDQCRTRQLVMRTVPKPGGRTEETRFVFMPTGFSVLPYQGGLLDQPAFVTDTFEQFLAAERSVAASQLSK